MNTHKVKIFIPLYNAEKTIGDTVKSLLLQSYDNFDLIISDNHSSDNSLKIINAFNDKRIKIIKTLNFSKIGEDNFNRCLDLSNEIFTAILHSDDIYHRDFLKNQIDNLLSDENIAISFTEGESIDTYGNVIGKLKIPAKTKHLSCSFYDIYPLILKNYNFLITPSVVFRTSIFKKNNFRWNFEKFKTSSDLALWLEVSLKYKISILKKNLISVRLSLLQGSSEVRDSIIQSDFFLVTNFYNRLYSINRKNSLIVNSSMPILIARDNLRILCNLIYLNEKKILSNDFADIINFNLLLNCFRKKYVIHISLYLILWFCNFIGLDNINSKIVSHLKKKFLI